MSLHVPAWIIRRLRFPVREEGVEFVWLTAPIAFEGTEHVTGVKVTKMRLGSPDASGRRAPEPDPGSEYSLEADLVIKALGYDAEDLLGIMPMDPKRPVDMREVIARIVDPEGRDSYTSTLIVRKGSGITLDDVLACGKRYSFGIGDAQSTSGTLAPLTFLFNPRGIVPAQCFSTVRSANHQANAFAVATGVVDVATSNSVNTIFMRRENPRLADQLEEIWQSPPIPESGIAIREDLDPALKEKIRSFFLTYGQGDGPEAERQRQVLAGLNYSMFRAADDSYLDPVREMVADQKLGEARAKNDQAGVAAAERELAALRAKREVQP